SPPLERTIRMVSYGYFFFQPAKIPTIVTLRIRDPGHFINITWPAGRKKCNRMETRFTFWKSGVVLLCGAHLPDPSPGHGRRRAHRILLAIHDLFRGRRQKLAGARRSLRVQPSS